MILGSNNEKEECDYLVSKLKNIKVVNLCGKYEITVIFCFT